MGGFGVTFYSAWRDGIRRVNSAPAILAGAWLLTMLVFLVIVTYWPALSIWLPQTLGMMR